MDTNWFTNNLGLVWLQIILLFFGIIFIIIALFRPKDNAFIEEKVEKLFDDFINQIDMENEEIIQRIKQSQSELPLQINEKINLLEKRVERIEVGSSLNATTNKGNDDSNVSPQVNKKYEEVLALYENGEDVDSIAKKTKMGHAEIKLILELSKKGFKYV